jgi:GntR family transcriptional repressor for pyruvate dehydrogenase complex
VRGQPVTVREAMLALELGGVVEVRPGSGTYLTGLGVPSANLVAPPVDSSPRELLHARQIIEPAVVQLCSLRIRPADVERLERLVDEAQAESESGEPGRLDQFVALSLAFHRELAACCGNSVLAGLTSHLVNAAEHPLWALVDGIVVRNPETHLPAGRTQGDPAGHRPWARRRSRCRHDNPPRRPRQPPFWA